MADETKKVVLEIDLNIANSAKNLTELKALQKQLNADFAKADIGTEAYKKLEVETGLVSKRIQQLKKDTNQLNAETGVQAGSLRDLQAQYNKLSQSLRETAPGNKVLGLSFQEAQKKAKALKGEIGDFEAKLGNFQGNVGNYAGSLKQASLDTGIFAGQTQALTQGFQGVSQGLKVAKLGFTTLKGAIIATGIGALLVAFGSLLQYFTSTEEGAETLERAFAGIGAAVDVIVGRAAILGKAIVQLFEGDFQGAADTASQAFDGITESITEAYTAAAELKQRLQDVEDEELKQSVLNAKRKNEVSLLIKQSKDRTKSEADRLALLNKAGAIEEAGAKREIELAKERYKIAQDQLAFDIKQGKISKGNISEEAAKAEIDYQNAIGATEEKLASIQARKAAFILEEQQLRDEALKKEEARIQKRRELEEKELQERIGRLQKFDQAEQALKQGRLQNQQKDIDNELALEATGYDRRIELLKEKELLQLEIEQNAMLVSLDNEQLTSDQRTLILENYAQTKQDLEAKLAADTKRINDEQQKKYEDDVKKRQQIDEQNNKLKLDSTKNTLGAVASLFDEQSEEYKALASAQAAIDTYQSATAAYKAVVGVPYVGPVLAGLAAAAATAQGLATIAKINGVTFEDGGIAGSGSKQGIIGGNYHSSGGTKFYGSDGSFFEAERDELLTVVNRHDTKRLRGLSALNSTHGKPFYALGGIAHGKSYLADGGFAARAAGGGVEESRRNLQDIMAIVDALPAPIVGVADIQTAAQKRNNVRVKANLTKNT